MTASPAGAQSGERGTVGSSMIAAKQFMGIANRNGVVVRAGAGLGELNVATLSKGDEVVVVGASGDYLRVLPPEGTFCLVPRARVNLRGDASDQKRTGRVTENTSIRVGSKVSPAIDKSPARLTAGEEVAVIGEDSIYYRIEPPKTVFFYVEKRDLSKAQEVRVREAARGWRISEVKEAAPAAEELTQETPAERPVADPTTDQDRQEPPEEEADPARDEETADETDLDEALEESADGDALADMEVSGEDDAPVTPPTTQPALVTQFQELDERYASAADLPLAEQPLEELKAGYQELLDAAGDDDAAAAIVPVLEARLQTIGIRQEAVQDLEAMQAMRKQLSERQQSLEVEQAELSERAAMKNITLYRAVGRIQASSLQIGGGSLFRLCDPGTGRTIIYLRADGDAAGEVTRLLERFAGVKGDVVEDKTRSLKYIEVTSASRVDQEQVFADVAAEIIPPSLLHQEAGTE